MPKTCENWLGFVSSWVYNARQTHVVYKLLQYSVDFKAPWEHW